MHIRLSQESDIAAILEISNWAALHTPANFAIELESLDDWLASWRDTHAQHPWLVATNDTGQVIGFAKSSPHRGRCAYAYTAEVSVYVHAEHLGRGVGRSLYARLIPILKSQGYVTLLAGITTPNPASERLHASFGFTRIGVFQRVGWKFNRWHDVSYWQLALQDAQAMPPTRILSVEEVVRTSSR
jgi:L-amino acid N-acyltransferase YncA